MVLKKAGGWGGGGAPPICKHLYHGFWVFENQPAWRQNKKSEGLWGGGGAAPAFANTFITGSERVQKGSVVAGAKILEVSLHGVIKKCGSWGGCSPPHLQTPLSRVLRGSICALSLLLG